MRFLPQMLPGAPPTLLLQKLMLLHSWSFGSHLHLALRQLAAPLLTLCALAQSALARGAAAVCWQEGA